MTFVIKYFNNYINYYLINGNKQNIFNVSCMLQKISHSLYFPFITCYFMFKICFFESDPLIIKFRMEYLMCFKYS